MLSRRELLKAGFTLPLAQVATVAHASGPSLASAPLAGHFSHDSVRLWIQATMPAKATISSWPETGKPADARRSEVKLPESTACSAIASISGLDADTRYRALVTMEGSEAGTTCRFRTAPAPGAPPRPFRVYLGSCAYTEAKSPSGNLYGSDFHIFDSIAARMDADALPHLMLWLGDNLYLRPKGKYLGEADFASVARMEARYRDVRALPMFQKLFAATHHYALWDDHDYGPNDADKTFAFKSDALRLFRQYWPNPDMGSTELPGTWMAFTHQDAEFFCLDDRSYRDDEKAPAGDNKTMFGNAQLGWLKASLRRSRATFKIVCNGSQLFSEDDNGHHSGWHNYRRERDYFVQWLAVEKITGLLFLSGDRHNTQVFRLKPGDAPVAYEFSCSPFTSRLSKLSKKDRANPRFVEGLGVEQHNFGTLEFTGIGSSRRIVASCFDADGKQLWQRMLASTKTGPDGEPQ